MREIKFRAWDRNTETLCNVARIDWSIGFDCHPAIYLVDRGWVTHSSDYILEQFTGLLDKNGREIYEGDCCAVTNPYNGATAGPARVMFSYEYVGGWVLTSDGENRLNMGTRTQHVAVIGNIHENPELLEER